MQEPGFCDVGEESELIDAFVTALTETNYLISWRFIQEMHRAAKRASICGKRENQVGGSPGDGHGGERVCGVDRGRHRGSWLHAARRWKNSVIVW